MKILVTGGAGYIGGTVTRLLLERGHSVVVYDNLCHARRSMVPPGATFVEGDVADNKRLEELFEDGSFAGVMHFAALIEAGESMQKPELYFRNNTAATLSLLEAMLKKNLNRLVFSSTAALYGEPVSTPIPEDAALFPPMPMENRNFWWSICSPGCTVFMACVMPACATSMSPARFPAGERRTSRSLT